MKNLYKRIFKVSSFENLIVSIFVIGYKNIGESIVVLFRDICDGSEKIIMSMVIDSYEKEDFNMIRKVLSKYHVDKLDFVCWTHPHCDHSPGIDSLIRDMFNENMVIFSPKFYYGNLMPDLLKSESSKTPEIFDNIWNQVKDHPSFSEIWRTISANGDATHPYLLQLLTEDGTSYKDVCFFFLTPIGSRTDVFATKGKQFGKPNELSVSFILSVDGCDFFFGGDTENEHAAGISKEIVRGMRWIKVPHHCSLGAKCIADSIGPQFDYAASTVFKSSNLPQEEIQIIYAKKGTLHMTQLEENDEYQPLYEYGIIQYDYQFSNDETIVNINTFGNAGQYFVSKTRSSDSDE